MRGGCGRQVQGHDRLGQVYRQVPGDDREQVYTLALAYGRQALAYGKQVLEDGRGQVLELVGGRVQVLVHSWEQEDGRAFPQDNVEFPHK